MPDVAEARKTKAAPEQDNVQPMKGRVDAIDQGRLYGWAFDPGEPGARLGIRVLQGSQVIAETVADRNRADLRRNGIGDGNHAFEILLPETALARAAELVVVARNGKGTEEKLRVPNADEQAAEALIAAPLTQVLDKLDLLMAAQRQLQVSQRSFLRAQQIDQSGEETQTVGLMEISDSIEGLGTEIGQRLNELDVHLMRLDGVIGGMEDKITDLQKRSGSDLKPVLLLLFVLVGFAAGAGLALFATV